MPKAFRGESLLPEEAPHDEAHSGLQQRSVPSACTQGPLPGPTVLECSKGEEPGHSWDIPKLLPGNQHYREAERETGQTQREKHRSRSGETDLKAQRGSCGLETERHRHTHTHRAAGKGNSEAQKLRQSLKHKFKDLKRSFWMPACPLLGSLRYLRLQPSILTTQQ